MKKSVLKIMAMLLALLAFQGCKDTSSPAPAPAITAFAPASGAVGTAVTITGINFGTTTDKNVVTFAGTPATVTAATATQLTVTVPQGAVTGKIALGVGSNSVSSATDFTVFGSPTITNFTPASALPGASVVITGTNFDATAANNTVKFNGVAATVTQASTTQLTVTVPATVTNGKITVVVNGLTATSATDFTVPPPTITSFTPLNGALGATVTITGTNYSTTPANNVVKFNGTVATVTQATATQLTVTVPTGASTGKISVGSVLSAVDFTVNTTITSLSASTGVVGKTIVITGVFFDASAANNVVTFNGTTAVVSQASTTQLTVEVPYGATTGKLSVTSNNGTPATKDFAIVSAWTQKTDLPVATVVSPSFVMGGVAYIGGGATQNGAAISDNWYKFDPSGAGSWTLIQSSVAAGFLITSGFSIGNDGYALCLTNGILYKYTPGTNAWAGVIASGTSNSNLNGNCESTFTLNNKGYMKDAQQGNLIEFDPASNGGGGSVTNVQAYPLGKSDSQASFVIGGVAYMGGGFYDVNGNRTGTDNFYKYTGGVWTALNNLPGTGYQSYLSAFAIGQYGYIIRGSQVWRYNPTNDTWTQLEDFPNTKNFFTTFSVGQKGYVASSGLLYQASSAVWEYDPSK